MLKKLAFFLGTTAGCATFAGTMGPVCTDVNITAPCASSAWSFGARALYLNPNYSVKSFHETLINITVPNYTGYSAGGDVYHTVNNHWNWGFNVEGSYLFRTGNDLNLNWYHYHHSFNQLISQQQNPQNSIFDDLSGNSFYSDVGASVKTQWDAVNLELGQVMNIGTSSMLRFQGGFQYARLQTTSQNAAVSNSTGEQAGQDQLFLNTTTNMKYHGFGPRIGIDFTYHLTHDFSLSAKTASALLIGPQNFNGTEVGEYNSSGFSAPPFTPINNSNSSLSTAIVPELEAKVGLDYTYALAQSNFTLNAGWMWVNYFNSLASTLQTSMNFGVQGPYLGLVWVGNVL